MLKPSAVALMTLALLTGCNSQNIYRVGNVQYETAHMPSWFATTVSGVNHCDYRMEVDEAGNCVPDHVTYAYASGIVPSFLGPALTAGAIAYAGHEIGAGAAQSGNSNNLNANQSVTQPGPWRGGYRH